VLSVKYEWVLLGDYAGFERIALLRLLMSGDAEYDSGGSGAVGSGNAIGGGGWDVNGSRHTLVLPRQARSYWVRGSALLVSALVILAGGEKHCNFRRKFSAAEEKHNASATASQRRIKDALIHRDLLPPIRSPGRGARSRSPGKSAVAPCPGSLLPVPEADYELLPVHPQLEHRHSLSGPVVGKVDA
jgi:hypothetical protein